MVEFLINRYLYVFNSTPVMERIVSFTELKRMCACSVFSKSFIAMFLRIIETSDPESSKTFRICPLRTTVVFSAPLGAEKHE